MGFLSSVTAWVAALPGPVATALVATIPSIELSVALPLGVLQFGLPMWLAYISAVSGSFLPVVAVLTCAEPFTRWLSARSRLANRFFRWLFSQTRERFAPKYHRYGEAALLLFTAFPLPIPFSGAWSGSLAAWIFGIPPHRAIPLLGLGIMIAGGIMVLLLLTGSSLLSVFLPK